MIMELYSTHIINSNEWLRSKPKVRYPSTECIAGQQVVYNASVYLGVVGPVAAALGVDGEAPQFGPHVHKAHRGEHLRRPQHFLLVLNGAVRLRAPQALQGAHQGPQQGAPSGYSPGSGISQIWSDFIILMRNYALRRNYAYGANFDVGFTYAYLAQLGA
jgi:hypothetical protein